MQSCLNTVYTRQVISGGKLRVTIIKRDDTALREMPKRMVFIINKQVNKFAISLSNSIGTAKRKEAALASLVLN